MKIGSKVVCVDNKPQNPRWGGIPPIIGETYTIRDDCPIDFLIGSLPQFCLLVELKAQSESGFGEIYYDKAWFRDIDEVGGSADEILKKAFETKEEFLQECKELEAETM